MSESTPKSNLDQHSTNSLHTNIYTCVTQFTVHSSSPLKQYAVQVVHRKFKAA
jgi:hypothetical protein